MAHTDVPFLSAKNEASKRAVLQAAFVNPHKQRVKWAWFGDSMSTQFGGAGNIRANALVRWMAQTYGYLHETPLLFNRTATQQYSVIGTATNISNSAARVTTLPEYPPNVDSLTRAYGGDITTSMAATYDPQLIWSASTNYAADIGAERCKHQLVMPVSGSISVKVYMATRPSAGTLRIDGRTYAGSDGISYFTYTLVASGLSNGQAAAEGNIVAITQPLTVNLTANQFYSCVFYMSGTVTDHVGARYVANDVTTGLSFDMYGHGGDDAQEWADHHGDTMHAIEQITSPDVIVLRFGMNDSFASSNATYDSGVRDIIDAVRAEWPNIPIIILGTTMCNNATYNGYITLQPALAATIASEYENVLAVNTLLVYNPATNFAYDTENITVSTAWATATSYVANDLRSTADGRKWKCLVAHTSSASNMPASPYWIEVNRTTVDGIHQNVFGSEAETFGVFARILEEVAKLASGSTAGSGGTGTSTGSLGLSTGTGLTV